MEKITMTRKQLKRNTVITQVIDGFRDIFKSY
jgi:hypothetical protein